MLLCKHDRHVAHNLVLRNLASHDHVDPSLAKHDPPNLHDMETNCVDVTADMDKSADFSYVTAASSISTPETRALENSDALASGDGGGLCGNSIDSLSSPLPSNTVVDALQNGLSEVSVHSSSCRNDGADPSTETVADLDAGGDSDYSSHAGRDDTDLHSPVMAEHDSAFGNQTTASLLPGHTSSSLTSADVPIQQVVYT